MSVLVFLQGRSIQRRIVREVVIVFCESPCPHILESRFGKRRSERIVSGSIVKHSPSPRRAVAWHIVLSQAEDTHSIPKIIFSALLTTGV